VPVLLGGVAAMSSASILIRLCGAPVLSIAAYRLALASLAFMIGAGFKRREREPFLVPNRWTVASGLFLAVHFAAWIQSLRLTSVASSVLLVQMAPIFVAIASALWLSEKPSGLQGMGILLATIGTLATAGLDFAAGTKPLLGDALALVGALGAAGYWIFGRIARRQLSTAAYVRTVYAISAVVLGAVAVAAGAPLAGFSRRDMLLLLLIALVPQCIGHTTFNWALRHLSATAVSVFALGEPVGAAVLAFFILHERPPAPNLVGALAVLAGIYLALRGEPKRG
jgi:drug/metabolite transporter (DMT)-like permease